MRPRAAAEVGDDSDSDAAGDRDSVPPSFAVVSQLVAGGAKLGDGRGRIRQLGLLHQQHVGPGAVQPPGDFFQAGFEGVDVLGGDRHDAT